MSKVTNYLMGTSTGKLGGVVTYKRKGEGCVRTYNPTIDDKKTGQQLTNRSAFGTVAMILALVKFQIASFWELKNPKQTSYSECVQFNMQTAVVTEDTPAYDEYGLPWFDKSVTDYDLSIAPETNAPLSALQVTNLVSGALVFVWDAEVLGIGGLATDKISFYCVNKTKKEMLSIPFSQGVLRSTETATINYPLRWANDDTITFIVITPTASMTPRQFKAGSDLANKVK